MVYVTYMAEREELQSNILHSSWSSERNYKQAILRRWEETASSRLPGGRFSGRWKGLRRRRCQREQIAIWILHLRQRGIVAHDVLSKHDSQALQSPTLR